MTNLQPLLDRLMTASGPDRELDKALWYKLIFDPGLDKDGYAFMKVMGHPSPAYTGSLDSALALVERKLPGWIISMIIRDAPVFAAVRDKSIIDPEKIEGIGYAPTAPLALLIALCRALTLEQAP